MFPSAYLLLLLAQPIIPPSQAEISVSLSAQTLELTWSDAEDRIQGSISPKQPVAGASLDVSAHVGSFQGAVFEGPVTFSFKPSGSRGGGQSKTVKRLAGEKAWRASFLPEEEGLYTLEV